MKTGAVEQQQTDAPKGGKKMFVVIAVVVFAVIAVSAGWWYWKGKNKETLSGEQKKKFEEEMKAFQLQGRTMFRDIAAMETHLQALNSRIARIQQEIQTSEKQTARAGVSSKASFDDDLTASEEESDLSVSFRLKTDADSEKNSTTQKMDAMRSALKENMMALNRFSGELAGKKKLFDQLYNEEEKEAWRREEKLKEQKT